MSDSVARKFQQQLRSNARIAEQVAMERENIRQKRRQAAIQQDSDLVKLKDTPELRQARWQATAEEWGKVNQERIERSLNRAFIAAAERGNTPVVMACLDEDFPVNYQDSETGETVLHVAAAGGARKVIRALISTGECDFLLRDRQGRLTSELAYLFGDDQILARYLGGKEKEQARKLGVKVTRRPAPAP